MNRRDFLKTASAATVAPAAQSVIGAQQASRSAAADDRATWIGNLRKIADPVLNNLANGTLKARMPVEQAAGANRQGVTHLEAIGRLLAGMAPWLELQAESADEGRLLSQYADLSRRAIARAVDPSSPDFLNFTRERQPLVDAAFLAQALLRSPRALRDSLDATAKRNLIAALESTRTASTTGCCSRQRSKQRLPGWVRPGIECASITRSGSTTSGTGATAPMATVRRSTGTTTTAS